jgi:hypothetical protein
MHAHGEAEDSDPFPAKKSMAYTRVSRGCRLGESIECRMVVVWAEVVIRHSNPETQATGA